MKLLALAALTMALYGCGNKAVDTESADTPPEPPLQRLSGTMTMDDSFSVIDKKTGLPFVTRHLMLNGTVDQLVRVREGTDGVLTIETEGNAPLTMSGKMTEKGEMSSDTPDANQIIKMRGKSDYTAVLGEFELTIRRSAIGNGDALGVRFKTPAQGSMSVEVNSRQGGVMSVSEAGSSLFMTSMESDASDPAKRVFKRDIDLFPALGAVPPAGGIDKMLYDGFKASPGIAHTGLVTAAKRQAWSYTGSKNFGIKDGETTWVEKVKLDLKLSQP